MNSKGTKKQNGQVLQRLLPYFMLLLPLAVLNLGFHFLSGIELYWREHAQKENVQQELEALTRSSTFDYRLSRNAGQFSDQIGNAMQASTNDEQLRQLIATVSSSSFSPLFNKFKLHVFRKSSKDRGAELFFCKSDKIESRRAMGMIFDYMLDQHQNSSISAETRKQRDKLAESYFGKTVRSEAFAASQKGRASFILQDNSQHWFIWDYQTSSNGATWGYFLSARYQESDAQTAQQIALNECQKRGTGLAGFISLIAADRPAVIFKELEKSALFRSWRRNVTSPQNNKLANLLEKGEPQPEQLGNFKIYSYLSTGAEYLTFFIAPVQKPRPVPIPIQLINMLLISLCLLLSLRGLLLRQWLEINLTLRFLLLYFLAAAFPLGLFSVTGFAYNYQSGRAAQNKIAANLEGCLRQFETARQQIQTDYKNTSRRLFSDPQLTALIAQHGMTHDLVKTRIIESFKNRENPLPLLGFYLLGIDGKGIEYAEATTFKKLNDIFSIYRAPIILNLREKFAKSNPETALPEFKISEEETFGGQAYGSVSGNDLQFEIEKRRNFSISMKSGEGNATLIYDFLIVQGHTQAALFFTWDDQSLFENTVKAAIENFKRNFPEFSFIAFRNTPQGLKTLFRQDDELTRQLFSGAVSVAENAAARGGTVKQHRAGYSVVAMPIGQNSDIVIAGLSAHDQITAAEQGRQIAFIVLMFTSFIIIALCAYFTAAFLLKPITDLKSAIDTVSSGDYSVTLSSQRADELGKLTREFAKMVDGIKERERLAALLSDHAVEALASKSDSTGESDARTFEGIALVSDIRNFTTLCETHPTHELTELLNQHFAVMAKVIASHGGRIYKFIGDAIEAVFDEHDAAATAESALKAAIEMNAARQIVNCERKAMGLFTYASGIGLARGRFYAGSVGSEETRLDYSIIGETFSQATQFETATKSCQGIPVVFDQAIAQLVGNRVKTTELMPAAAGFTFASDDEYSAKITREFSLKPHENAVSLSALQVKLSGDNQAGFFQQNFKWLAAIMATVLIVIAAIGAYQGFAWRNLLIAGYYENFAREQARRLLRQISSEEASTVAFETKMRQLIGNIEKYLSFQYKPTEGETFTAELENELNELRSIGIEPRRVFVISNRPGSPASPKVAFSMGINQDEKNLFLKMAQFMHLSYQKADTDDLLSGIEPQLQALLGRSIHYVCGEKIGSALQIAPDEESDLFYWNYIGVYSDKFKEMPLPESNYKLSSMGSAAHRKAGVIIIYVSKKSARNNPDLLVSGYAEPGCEIALISETAKAYTSQGFPSGLPILDSRIKAAEYVSDRYVFEESQILINHKPFRAIVAIAMPPEGKINLNIIAIIALIISALILAYLIRSVYAETALTRSIQLKLIFSILLTAVVPMITVAFVSDFFTFENHQAMLHQQKLDIQRNLDTYEPKQYYYETRLEQLLQNASRDPRIVSLGQKLDQNPASTELRSELGDLLTRTFNKLDAQKDWTSNAKARDAMLISRKNWDFKLNKKSGNDDAFAGILNLIGKHLLTRLNEAGRTSDLSMKDLKSEMFYEGAMRSIRSNFGDLAYIKLTNAIGQMTEFEITTGAAGIMAVPLPSIEQPDYLLVWVVQLNRGGYLMSIAKRNQGPIAIFTGEYEKQGELMASFLPFPGLSLEKAAAWIYSSNLPVSFEQVIGSEKISMEGRPGIHQINNFMIGAASQTPVDRLTAQTRKYILYFMALALLIFILVGYQTASDIMLPIGALTEGMRHISLQNYFYRIGLDRNDELGQLCASYDRFAKGLAEKEVMGKMLSRSAQLAMTGSADAGGQLLSSKREFVLIFIGSTDFAQRLSGENTGELFKQLKDQVALLCRIVIENGGDIDKLMGDKILGVFATSGGNSQAARQSAINAARMIMQAEQAGELHFPVAIGINAGEVISGMLGFGAKRDFTVIGDAVNVSARIEKEAEKLPAQRCLFSHEFVSVLANASAFGLHSEAALKGKAATLKLYRLT